MVIAVAMLAWHNVWMVSHGRELAQQLKNAARAVTDGRSERSVTLLVIALAVMREGSEAATIRHGLIGFGMMWASRRASLAQAT